MAHTRERRTGKPKPPDGSRSPRKEFGQHFISDRNILLKLARAAELEPGAVVLEIGPGRGDLTRVIAASGAQVVAVEIDRDLAAELQAEFAQTPGVTVAQGDILSRPPEKWLETGKLAPPYQVVANLPYYITSAILRYLLEAETPPRSLIVMVQLEVARQIVAAPPHGNLLGVSVQFYGVPRIVDRVPAGAFFPRPKVDSAIVRIEVRPPPRGVEPTGFFRFVRAGFGSKRKQLRNALAHGLGITAADAEALLHTAGIQTTRRAETLALDEWTELYRAWSRRAN